ncbi:MAG: hypothetical protein IPP88_02385 [Betaproteobacteria bacterium]|nr:hypothetical protein [Betaproteobacteria bacterium]
MIFTLRKPQFASCVAGLALSFSGLAADTPPASSGLAYALEQAWRLYPQAAGLDAREIEAIAAREAAASLTPESGSVSIGNLNDRINRNLGRQEWEIELATPLWLPGQKVAREAEAASRIDEVVAKRAALRWELAGEVRDAWWALATARNVRVWQPAASKPRTRWKPTCGIATKWVSCHASTPTLRSPKYMLPKRS